MPRICVTSDVHLGLTAEAVVEALVDAIAAERPDLTVIAGDVAEGLRAFRRCLAIFARLPGDLGVIAGNHDLWAGQGVSSEQLWSTALPAATREAGGIYLEDEDWRQDGVAVVGTIAWYDYSAAMRRFPHRSATYYARRKRKIVVDGIRLDWTREDQAFARSLGARTLERLAALEADPTIAAIALVTHVPVFAEQLVHYAGDGSATRAYFSHLTLGDDVRWSPKLRVVCSGHTHRGYEGVMARASLPPLNVVTLESDYGAPAYRCFDLPARSGSIS
ncbi:MAG TPA: metallophosphoesterase [Ktedonobacterales bacterium]|jgi:predicted MPP superfamily phosphohydrolase